MACFLLLVSPLFLWAQEKDTIRVYLDENLQFTSPKKAYYPAIAYKSGDHWTLTAVYPDTMFLLSATYAHQNLRIKDGAFTLYHPHRVRAMEGVYVNNVQEGHWNYWHPNGMLKDSGTITHNYLTGTWCSYDEQGMPLTCAHYLDEKEVQLLTPPTAPNNKKPGIFQKDTLTSILQGPWVSYYANGNVKEKGTFEYNKRTGLWETFYPSGIKESSGRYDRNKPKDAWTFYHLNGQPSTQEFYNDQGLVTQLSCFDTTGKFTGVTCSLVKPPVPAVEGFNDMQNFILDHIFWPKELEDAQYSGMVKASCTIDLDGNLTKIEILDSPHPLMSAEVERFFKSIEKWSPAISHNRPIPYTFKIEIPFIR